jgi:hypothetical protein
MGAVWGVVSSKFVITAAGLLISSRIDQSRLNALVDPYVTASAVSRSFAEQHHLGVAGAVQTSSRRPLTIGIGGEEFNQPSLAIADNMPVSDTDMVIGRDLLAAHIFVLDIDRRDISVLGKADAERLSQHFIAVPLITGEEGQLLVAIEIDGLRSEAAICLGQSAPLELGKGFWQSSPPGQAAHITLGGEQLTDIPWPDQAFASDRATLGPGAFKGRTIVLDLPRRRLWISVAPTRR